MKTTLGRLTAGFVVMVWALLMCHVPLSFGDHNKHREKPGRKIHPHYPKEANQAWKHWRKQEHERWKRAEEREREARKHREEPEREASKHEGGDSHQLGSHPESRPPAHGPEIEVQTVYGAIGIRL